MVVELSCVKSKIDAPSRIEEGLFAVTAFSLHPSLKTSEAMLDGEVGAFSGGPYSSLLSADKEVLGRESMIDDSRLSVRCDVVAIGGDTRKPVMEVNRLRRSCSCTALCFFARSMLGLLRGILLGLPVLLAGLRLRVV